MTSPPFVRRQLDRLYLLSGVLAAVFLVGILVLIVLQMLARWIGVPFPGASDYAGYCMAAASFLAFAHALDHGAHIRVRLLLNLAGPHRRWVELWCFGIGTLLAGYLAWYAVKTVYWSYLLNDVSQGQDATPLWIPQLAMAVGAVILTICLLDHFVRTLRAGATESSSLTMDQGLS